MKIKKTLHVYRALLIVLCLSLWGCSDGSSYIANIIGGVASKGIINQGSVRAYAIQDDGTKGVELDSVLTDASGNYSIDLGDYAGPVIVEVTGGTYIDEATGLVINNNTLRAVIPPVNGTKKVALTPLTEMAVQLAGSPLTLAKINNANAAVSVLMGGVDIIETQPQDINADLSGATDAEKNYTIVLAAISQMVEDGGVADVDDAIAIIKNDLEDDGQLVAAESGALLEAALDNFIASAENNTGLTENDITLDEAIVDAAVKFVMTTEEMDWDFDNVAEERSIYTYDADGNLIMAESDGDSTEDDYADGVIDSLATYIYDANGKLARIETDFNVDGVVNVIRTYTYDASGNMTIKDMEIIGYGTTRFLYSYNATGNIELEQKDNEADGIIDYQAFYTYDNNGNLYMKEIDSTGDNFINNESIYIYDDDGNLIQREYSAGGLLLSIGVYTNDVDGRLILEEAFNGPDGEGTPGLRTIAYAYIYDANGNKTKQEIDWNGDGVLDEETIYTWQQL